MFLELPATSSFQKDVLKLQACIAAVFWLVRPRALVPSRCGSHAGVRAALVDVDYC